MLVTHHDVANALKSDQVVPCFQPIVELHSSRLIGFEVLARWKHAEQGLILPANFIALAEEHGLIGELTEQVFRRAFVAAVKLPEALMLSVNISPLQLRDLKLPQQIRRLGAETRFALERLTVEITEAALLDNLEMAGTIMRELKGMGCRLSLDDFGTGYSSLAHLQGLPFDEIKIDRSFVKNMADTRQSRKIVGAIIGLGHSLGLKTIAEGVETEEQAAMLVHLEANYVQGWLYGRPVPTEKLAAMIEEAPRMVPIQLATGADKFEVSCLEALPTQRLAQLRAIYDGAPVGLCFLDRELRYVSANQKLADFTGQSVASYLGKTMKELLPDTYRKAEPFLKRALLGEPISGLVLNRIPAEASGREMTILVSYQPAWDEAGEVIGISVSVSDITEKKRTEYYIREDENQYPLFQPVVFAA